MLACFCWFWWEFSVTPGSECIFIFQIRVALSYYFLNFFSVSFLCCLSGTSILWMLLCLREILSFLSILLFHESSSLLFSFIASIILSLIPLLLPDCYSLHQMYFSSCFLHCLYLNLFLCFYICGNGNTHGFHSFLNLSEYPYDCCSKFSIRYVTYMFCLDLVLSVGINSSVFSFLSISLPLSSG